MCSRPVSCSRRRTRAVACFDQMRRAAELKNKLVGTPRGRAWPCRADDGWPCLMVCSPPPRPIYRCAPRLYRAKCHAIFFAAIRNENIRYFVSLFALPACYPQQDLSNGTVSVRRSVCLSSGSLQQTQCCRFAAVGPAGTRYRSIAARLLAVVPN